MVPVYDERTGTGSARGGTALPAALDVALAAALAVALGACVSTAPERQAGGACEADTAGALAAPIYAFRGEPLNLDRDARERVDRWVGFFRDRRPDLFATFLRRSGRYEQSIREALDAADMPQDFLYLALIESGMNPRAISRAEAVGLWQFLESTGRMYGLEVTSSLDERRRPDRATAAAILYLSDLHEQFGDWFLAAAAYNAGPGRVRRAVRRGGISDSWTLVRRGLLPRETAEYVPKLLAAARLAAEPGLHGFGLVRPEPPPPFEPVRVPGRNRLSVLAAAAGVDEAALRDLNPWLVSEATPAGQWSEVRLPAGTAARFQQVYAWIPPHHRRGTLTHRIREGETIDRIARAYGATVEGILAVNPEVRPLRLRPGEEIQVPPEASTGVLGSGNGLE